MTSVRSESPEGADADLALRGIGLDAVDVHRFSRVLARRPAMELRVFTDVERGDARRPGSSQPRLAARFAAKEAVMKALGVGIGAFDFRDVEVRRAETGAPSISLKGRAASIATRRGVSSWLVSITHTDSIAIASVAALGARRVEGDRR